MALLALAALVVVAPSASAHASVVGTDPAQGAVLDAAPARVSVTFSEAVTLVEGTFSVAGSQDGRRWDAGTVTYSGDHRTATTALVGDLPDGSYVVSWRIVSQDTHVTGGSVSFAVGAPDAAFAPQDADDAPGSTDVGAPGALGALGVIARWLTNVGTSLLAGTALVVVVVPGLRRPRSTPRRQWTGLGLVVVGSLLQLLTQVAATSADGRSGLGLGSAWTQTLGSTTGVALGVRLVALTGWVAVLVRRRTSGAGPASFLLAVLLAVSVALAGHASAAAVVPLAVGLTAVHVLAAATWLGGLVLVVGALRGPGRQGSRAALGELSRLAVVTVVVLAASGVVRALAEVQPPAALWSTGYGRVLLAKSVLLGALLLLGDAARRAVRDGRAAQAGPAGLRFRRVVALESLVAVVVLGLSATLAVTPPARAQHVTAWQRTVVLGDVAADLRVPRVRPGPVELTVDLRWDEPGTRDHPPLPDELTASLTEPARGIGPVGVTFRRDYAAPADVTRYVSVGAGLPAPGRWDVEVVATLDEVTAYTATARLPVR